MSLVSEALRKARREAEEQGRPPEPRPRFFFSGTGRIDSRLGTGLVLGAIITIAAAAAGGLVAWWAIGGRQPVVATTQPPVSAAPAGDAGPAAADTVAAASTEGAAVRVSGAEEIRSSSRGGDEGATGREAESVQAEPGGAEQIAAVAQTPIVMPSPSPPPPRTDAGGPRDFVAEATVGDVTLTLGYLVYRPTDPFAQINGVDMRVGATIEGFVVDEITRDRVVLHDDDGPVVIRVR